jgi:uncharacterized membrane protein
MAWLILGIAFWSVAHLLRSVAPRLRQSMLTSLGPQGYRAIFSLAIVASVVLMVVGWQGSPARAVYAPPAWGSTAAQLLMIAAFVLFAASGVPTNIKRFVRHPQLTGVALWSLAHLLANGDSRSLVLFVGIGAWAIVEMPLINRREGEWSKPPPLPFRAEIKPVVGGLVAYLVLFLAHPYLFGVSPG